jgi:hypothetical protein
MQGPAAHGSVTGGRIELTFRVKMLQGANSWGLPGCLRITRSKSGVGFDVVPMHFLPTEGEATTFAYMLEVASVNGDLWFEVATRTVDVAAPVSGLICARKEFSSVSFAFVLTSNS